MFTLSVLIAITKQIFLVMNIVKTNSLILYIGGEIAINLV